MVIQGKRPFQESFNIVLKPKADPQRAQSKAASDTLVVVDKNHRCGTHKEVCILERSWPDLWSIVEANCVERKTSVFFCSELAHEKVLLLSVNVEDASVMELIFPSVEINSKHAFRFCFHIFPGT